MKANMSASILNLPTYTPTSLLPRFSIHYPTNSHSYKPIISTRAPLISCCLNSTTTEALQDETTSHELLPPVKKKRKVYRRMRPGEAKGITEEMRFVAMKLREKKLKVKTEKLDENAENDGSDDNDNDNDNDIDNDNGNGNGNGNDDGEDEEEGGDDGTWEPELDGFLRYLVDSRFVFSRIESLVDESQDVSFAYFRNTGLERSESFTKDLEWLSEQNMTIPEPLFTSKKYVKYLEELAAQSPPLFFCHLYNIYFSHISGGQVIATKVSEKLLEGRELEICKWPGDPEELLRDMRDKLNALGQHWSRDEKNKCLKETSKCFMYMGTIIRLIIMR